MVGHNKTTIAERPDEDLPEFDTAYWAERIDAAPVKRGHPTAEVSRVSTTIRLDPDVLEAFHTQDPGWQNRINAVLHEAIGLHLDHTAAGVAPLQSRDTRVS